MKKESNLKYLISISITALFVLAAWRVHMGVQTTMIGYELGRLKNSEASLLEERSLLKMELSKLTTKSHLILVANYEDLTNENGGRFAAR